MDLIVFTLKTSGGIFKVSFEFVEQWVSERRENSSWSRHLRMIWSINKSIIYWLQLSDHQQHWACVCLHVCVSVCSSVSWSNWFSEYYWYRWTHSFPASVYSLRTSSSVKQALPKHGAIFKIFLLFCHHLSVCEVISKIIVNVCTCEYSLPFSVLKWENRKKKLLSD